MVCLQEYRLEVILRSYMNQLSQEGSELGQCCDAEGQNPSSLLNCHDRPCDPYFIISTVDLSTDVCTVQNTTPVFIDKDALMFNELGSYVIHGNDMLWQVHTKCIIIVYPYA